MKFTKYIFIVLLVLIGTAAVVVPSEVGAELAPGAPESVFNSTLPCEEINNTNALKCSGPGGDPNSSPLTNKAYLNTVQSWDGTPLDVNLFLPNEVKQKLPLLIYSSGFGESKKEYNTDAFIQKLMNNYDIAVLTITERGFGFSCGTRNSIDTLKESAYGSESCDNGFSHLMDARYEVRDSQYLAGVLADEGIINPEKIASLGMSYGGAKSVFLSVMKNRTMNESGILIPWKSPEGVDLNISSSVSIAGWSDLAASLMPNGSTIDYMSDNSYGSKVGSPKTGLINLLFSWGVNYSGDFNYPVKKDWDFREWKERIFSGEPYNDALSKNIINQLTNFHSPYYIDNSIKPAPLLMSSGTTDELFPANESLKMYNKIKTRYSNAEIRLFIAPIGHPRTPFLGPNALGSPTHKSENLKLAEEIIKKYTLGDENERLNSAEVEIRSLACPFGLSSSSFSYSKYSKSTLGEVRATKQKKMIIDKNSGPASSGEFSTVSDICSSSDKKTYPGSININLPKIPNNMFGYTLSGSPVIIADIKSPNGPDSQIIVRLLENQGNQQRLISRAIYKPNKSGRQIIQMNPMFYNFGINTRPQIQLIAQDGSGNTFDYSKKSNLQKSITVSNIDVRLPIAENYGNFISDKSFIKPLPLVIPNSNVFYEYKKRKTVKLNKTLKIPNNGYLKKKKYIKISLPCKNYSLCDYPEFKIISRTKGLKDSLLGKSSSQSVLFKEKTTLVIKLTRRAKKLLKPFYKNKRNKNIRAKIVYSKKTKLKSSSILIKF